MKHARALLCLGILIAAGPAWAKPAYVPSTVNLRAAPGTKSEIVAKIPGGSLVESKECSEGWCEITWQDKAGFAIATALDMSGRVPRQTQAQTQPPAQPRRLEPGAGYSTAPRYVEEEQVYYEPVPPPVYYGPYYRPYGGWRRHWW